MNEIGIITIVDGANYGNVLQNYAMQHVLNEFSYTCETIRRKTFRTKRGILLLLKDFKLIVKGILLHTHDAQIIKRRKKFTLFCNKYIKYSNFIIGYNSFPKKKEKQYKYFVFGSDQIWNPNFKIIYDDIDNYFGTFTDSSKKIAYAASFGISEIPEKWISYYSDKLKTFPLLGVREQEGKMLVDKLTGQEAIVVPDPTLLLNKDEWKLIERKPKNLKNNDKYILTYFLGKISERINKQINNYAQNHGYNIIKLNNSIYNCDTKESIKMFSAGPDEFLWLIRNCECMITDSFHGSVFSVIYGKSFQVFHRETIENNNNMDSRVKTLLKTFSLENRFGNNRLDEDLLESALNITHIDNVLLQLKQKAFQFISDSLR